ncbi:MAG: Rpn family recombination-promoting nuclease/putative transposase [Okeania sp. SIO2H7]|nr:Rpn family recombination-promoting nuclease/putative transposase [Okeania sp. SIO2H7]
MKFISPKVDYAFKKIFGSDQSQEILVSFLNGIIYEEKSTIKSLTIADPYHSDRPEDLKNTKVRASTVLNDDSTLVIDLGVSLGKDARKEAIYSMTQTYLSQAPSEDYFWLLHPVTALRISDVLLFDRAEEVVNSFAFAEAEKGFLDRKFPLEMFVVELPRFNKSLAELNTLQDKWIYFLKEASNLEEIPEVLAEVTEIERAFNLANEANMTAAELEELRGRSMMFYDESGRQIPGAIEAVVNC